MSRATRILLWCIGLSFVLPFLLLGLWSIADGWRYPTLWPEITGQHWQRLTSGQSLLLQGLCRSLGLATTVSMISTLLGFYTSRAIAYHRHKHWWMFVAYWPYVIAPVILAALVYLFFLRWGWAGTWGGVWMGHFFLALPYAVILFHPFWTARIQQFEQLATTLGATRHQVFRQVLFPLSKGILLVGGFQTFLISWFEFGLTSLLGVGKVQTLPVLVYQYMQEANPYLAAVAALILMLPPAVVLWVNKRFLFTKLV